MLKGRKKVWTAMAAAMAALSVALLATGFAQAQQLNVAREHISAVYHKAFYETCELTEAMSVNLRKLLVAGDGGQMQQLLGDVTRQAQGVSGNLALLPLGEDEVSATLKFINQVGDFSEGLSVRLAAGGAIGSGDYAAIASLSENAAEFSVGMAGLLERLESGQTVLDGSQASGAQNMAPLTDPAAQYPTLLYDGPFSDGARGSEYRALEGLSEVTADQARQNLNAYLDNVTEIVLTGESDIPLHCYEFNVTANGYSLTAGVTKRSGRVLYVLSDADVTEINYTADRLLDAARAFLLSRGYGPMEMSYYSQHDGILTVNYAAVQDGVVLYPDLVKVQLSMRDGAVIGVEAGGYLMNHVSRVLPQPVLTEEEAIARMSARLTPLSARLSLIPVGSAEVLCYEIRATDGADMFLVYIDAQTGAERELMQVFSGDGGSLVM